MFQKSVDLSNLSGQNGTMAEHSGRGGTRSGAGRKRVVLDPERKGIDFERADLNALRAIAADRETSVASLVRRAVQQFLRRTRAR
jgi:hypothetical protein